MVLNLLKTTVKGNMIHFVFQGVHKDKNKLSLWLPERAGTGALWVIHRESLARENHTDSEHSCPKWRLTAALSFPGAHYGLAFELPLP